MFPVGCWYSSTTSSDLILPLTYERGTLKKVLAVMDSLFSPRLRTSNGRNRTHFVTLTFNLQEPLVFIWFHWCRLLTVSLFKSCTKGNYKIYLHRSKILFEPSHWLLWPIKLHSIIWKGNQTMACSKEVNFQYKKKERLLEMFLKFKAFSISKGHF